MYNIKFKALSKRGYFTLLALLIAITSFAQEITINGVVIDETDTPLIGATVQVKNTQKGVNIVRPAEIVVWTAYKLT